LLIWLFGDLMIWDNSEGIAYL